MRACRLADGSPSVWCRRSGTLSSRGVFWDMAIDGRRVRAPWLASCGGLTSRSGGAAAAALPLHENAPPSVERSTRVPTPGCERPRRTPAETPRLPDGRRDVADLGLGGRYVTSRVVTEPVGPKGGSTPPCYQASGWSRASSREMHVGRRVQERPDRTCRRWRVPRSAAISNMEPGTCLKMCGRDEEFRRTLQGAWLCFIARPRSYGKKTQISCLGSRRSTRGEFTSYGNGASPNDEKDRRKVAQGRGGVPTVYIRGAQQDMALGSLWDSAGVPRWDAAVVATRWRWAGHLARTSQREPTRWTCVVSGWRDTWWRKTPLVVLHRDTDAGRQRLNRGHTFFGKRRQDEALQQHSDVELEQPWQLTAQTREVWNQLECPL